jgi:hypothetical protein
MVKNVSIYMHQYPNNLPHALLVVRTMIQEKIRLATLFEFVSYSGHTLVSWAGAVGTGKAESGHMSCVGLRSVFAHT